MNFERLLSLFPDMGLNLAPNFPRRNNTFSVWEWRCYILNCFMMMKESLTWGFCLEVCSIRGKAAECTCGREFSAEKLEQSIKRKQINKVSLENTHKVFIAGLENGSTFPGSRVGGRR